MDALPAGSVHLGAHVTSLRYESPEYQHLHQRHGHQHAPLPPPGAPLLPGGKGTWSVVERGGRPSGPFDAVVWAAPVGGMCGGSGAAVVYDGVHVAFPAPPPARSGASGASGSRSGSYEGGAPGGSAPIASVTLAFNKEQLKQPLPRHMLSCMIPAAGWLQLGVGY